MPVVSQNMRILLTRKWIELLDSNQRRVVDPVDLAGFEKIEIDFTAAKNHTSHLLFVQWFDLRNHEVETAGRQRGKRRHGHLVP